MITKSLFGYTSHGEIEGSTFLPGIFSCPRYILHSFAYSIYTKITRTERNVFDIIALGL